jgi:hypothetical protein
MSQDTKSIVIIINEPVMNKNEEYKELLQKVLPFTKSDNKVVKTAAYDFNLLLKCAINEKNSQILVYLHEGIKHAIEYFTKNLLDLINNRIDPDTDMCDPVYGLLNDISKAITNQILFRNKLEELKNFLMEL